MAGLDAGPARATVSGSFEAPGTTLVSIAGELDLASVPRVEAELEPFLDATPNGVVFDLSAVSFMDSSGIAMLLRAAERVVAIEVRNPSTCVRLIIRATGLAEFLHADP